MKITETLFEFRMRFPGFGPDKVAEHRENGFLICTSHPYEENGVVMILAKGRPRKFEKESVDAYRISGDNPELFAISMSKHQKTIENNKLVRSTDAQ